MSIYTCNQVSAGSAPSIFQERGLNSTSAKIDDCGVVVVKTKQLSPVFIALSANLSHFGHALQEGEVVRMDEPYRNVLRDLDGFDASPPIVAIKFVADTDEERDMLVAGGMVEAPGDRKNTWIGAPTLDQIRALGKGGVALSNVVPAGNTPLNGALAFYYGWKAVTLAAMFSNSCLQLRNLYGVTGEELAGVDASVGIAPDGKSNDDDETRNRFLEEEDIALVGQKIFNLSTLEWLAVAPKSGYVDSKSLKFTTSYSPRTQGIVFPYFDGLLEPSKEFSQGVFFRYFSSCFSESLEEMVQMMPILRSGFRALAVSPAGRALSHALFGVQSMFETGSTIRFLFSGATYLGFVLTGDFKVLNKGKVVDPAKPLDLAREIEALDKHRFALEHLVEVLSGLELKIGGTKKISTADVATSRMLAYEFQIRRVVSESMFNLSAKEYVGRLQYNDTFWSITPDHVILAVKAMMRNGDLDGPFHCTWENLVSEDPIRRALAVFGRSAPSLVAGSRSVMITPPGSRCKNVEVDSDGKRLMQYIPIYEKGIVPATADWRFIQTKHQMKFIGSSKKVGGNIVGYADRSKDVAIAGGQEMLNFYETIREFAYANQVIGRSTGKRGREEDDVEEGGSKGKGKTPRSEKRAKAVDLF